MPPAEAVSIAAALGHGLGALHRVGYLHGDVKPSNIGFTSQLAEAARPRSGSPAKDGTAGGTLRYMSPEMLAGRSAEETDDTWSLCVVLHEMVAGRHPFMDGDADVVMEGIRPPADCPRRQAGVGFRAVVGGAGVHRIDALGTAIGASGNGAGVHRHSSRVAGMKPLIGDIGVDPGIQAAQDRPSADEQQSHAPSAPPRASRRLLHVQRSGDVGSPRVTGSTSASSAPRMAEGLGFEPRRRSRA